MHSPCTSCEICHRLLCIPPEQYGFDAREQEPHEQKSSEEQSLPLLSRPPRVSRPVQRLGFEVTPNPEGSNVQMSRAENQSTTGFRNLGNTCYINSTLRLLNITRKDIEKVLNKEEGPLHAEIRKIWKHCADEKNKKTAYCMKNFFREFVECDISMIKSSNEKIEKKKK